jgi:hypothetical protein
MSANQPGKQLQQGHRPPMKVWVLAALLFTCGVYLLVTEEQ